MSMVYELGHQHAICDSNSTTAPCNKGLKKEQHCFPHLRSTLPEFLKANAEEWHTRDSFTPSGVARLHHGRVLCIFLRSEPGNAVFLQPVQSRPWGHKQCISTDQTELVLYSHLVPAQGYVCANTGATTLACQQQLCLSLEVKQV